MPSDLSQVVFAVGRQDAGGISLLGTAFAVSKNKIATAYHVVGANDDGLCIITPRIRSMMDYQDTADTDVNVVQARMVDADPFRDLCILQVDAFTMTFNYGIGSADSTPAGAPVATWGFPHANFGRMVLTQQQAHVGARVLIENTGQKNKHIVLNTQAREGQSGGPVLDENTGTVVGVLLGSYAPGGGGAISLGGVDPATLHQTTHAISAEYLREML